MRNYRFVGTVRVLDFKVVKAQIAKIMLLGEIPGDQVLKACGFEPDAMDIKTVSDVKPDMWMFFGEGKNGDSRCLMVSEYGACMLAGVRGSSFFVSGKKTLQCGKNIIHVDKYLNPVMR